MLPMVEGHVAVICVAVAALALTAAALGIVGEATTKSEATRAHASPFIWPVQTDGYDGANCVYRRTPAFGFGVAAAASLLTGQVVLTAAAGFWGHCNCRARFDHRRRAGVVLSLLSWFLAILAACAFLVGALKNQSGERRPKEGVTTFYRCTVLVAGVFAGGSLFAVAAAVGITSYVAHEATASTGSAQPPLPTTSETDGHSSRQSSCL